MSARGKARKRALDLLFEADLRDVPVASLLATRPAVDQPQGYAAEIVTGVVEHVEEIDELLSTYAVGWTLDRMPAVDRAILRVGAWELLHNPQVPDAVAIDEAVRLATELSTDASPTFVNGLLARLLDVRGAPTQQ